MTDCINMDPLCYAVVINTSTFQENGPPVQKFSFFYITLSKEVKQFVAKLLSLGLKKYLSNK